MITQLVLASLFITGLYTLCLYEVERSKFLSKQPLWFLAYYSRKWIGEYWSKPLFTCNVCMSSFWGAVFYTSFVLNQDFLDGGDLIYGIIFIIALTGINKIMYERFIG